MFSKSLMGRGMRSPLLQLKAQNLAPKNSFLSNNQLAPASQYLASRPLNVQDKANMSASTFLLSSVPMRQFGIFSNLFKRKPQQEAPEKQSDKADKKGQAS
mmetsp:Transcript_11159/g.18745  ORF Transcript_11159/g.18745 Transcript_11159/m.18745 type:complete len:101 (+) Transcript_11159:32-334(+)